MTLHLWTILVAIALLPFILVITLVSTLDATDDPEEPTQ